MDFIAMPKTPRWSREIIITEKIDGTNACIHIGLDGEFLTGSRNRWITPTDDNYGFSKWAHENKEELLVKLGAGTHYGEWWGEGIQRRYGVEGKHFSLFDALRWEHRRPPCCKVVPILYRGVNSEQAILDTLEDLSKNGSVVAKGFMNPEGIIIYHKAADICFKKTLYKDEIPKLSLKL